MVLYGTRATGWPLSWQICPRAGVWAVCADCGSVVPPVRSRAIWLSYENVYVTQIPVLLELGGFVDGFQQGGVCSHDILLLCSGKVHWMGRGEIAPSPLDFSCVAVAVGFDADPHTGNLDHQAVIAMLDGAAEGSVGGGLV